ncbi:acetyltransferase [Candidatus Cardinium hertigii]|jgi:sugar O-acyltransferase (sialic acid O-acetyltransferase NeuD family)|uniref:Acetyltransferase n=1 Tax=Candidatus Cardinium hertigii TaxID=247481 RepID=A0A3N2QDG2_9BACT|nr:acetyltransferase [Candidatus Cardinium hertigii]ROT47811.1 acetyltransferase [Candidatus Cardinium hertigii]
MNNGLIIFGICALTKGALDIFLKNNVMVYGILEDDPKWHHTDLCGIPILGATDNQKFLNLLQGACVSFLAYGNITKRKKILDLLTAQVKQTLISAIHPSAIIADPIKLGQSNYIGAQVCLAPEVAIGNHCVVHNGVIIEEQASIDDWVQIGAGSVIGAYVTLGEGVSIGIGARIVAGVSIQKGVHIHAGAVVLENVKNDDSL